MFVLTSKTNFATDRGVADQNGVMGSMMQDLAFAIPGVDEAMGFAEIMKLVSGIQTLAWLNYSVKTR